MEKAPGLDTGGRQLERVRRICSAMPEVTEKLSHGSPTFFARKRPFAAFTDNHHHDGHVAVWLAAAPGVQALLVKKSPGTFFRPPYVGGSGWIGVELGAVGDDELTHLIRDAWRMIAPKKLSATG